MLIDVILAVGSSLRMYHGKYTQQSYEDTFNKQIVRCRVAQAL